MSNLACAICYDSFYACVPRVLPCGHSLCSGCLRSLMENKCPFCKGKFEDPAKIPVNYSLQGSVKNSAPRHDCRSCPYPPQKWCIRCSYAICQVAQEDNWHPDHPLCDLNNQAEKLREKISQKKKDAQQLLISKLESVPPSLEENLFQLVTATERRLVNEITDEQKARQELTRQREQAIDAHLKKLETLRQRLENFTPEALVEISSLLSVDLQLPSLPLEWNTWLTSKYVDILRETIEEVTKLSIAQSQSTVNVPAQLIDSGTEEPSAIQNSRPIKVSRRAPMGDRSVVCQGFSTAHCDGFAVTPYACDNAWKDRAVLSIESNDCAGLEVATRGQNINDYLHDRTLLTFAVQEKKIEVIDWLLRRGAEVNQKDRNDKSPLHYALDNEDWESRYVICQKLIAAGADIRGIIIGGLTAYEYIEDESGDEKLLDLLRHHLE